MSDCLHLLRRWGFSLAMMVAIFIFSSIPSSEMPNFLGADLLVKKSGHIVVFSLLAIANWYALGWNKEKILQAWLLAFLYAIFDEIHQSFTPGRNPWWVDVVIDSIAAMVALGIAYWWRSKKLDRD